MSDLKTRLKELIAEYDDPEQLLLDAAEALKEFGESTLKNYQNGGSKDGLSKSFGERDLKFANAINEWIENIDDCDYTPTPLLETYDRSIDYSQEYYR